MRVESTVAGAVEPVVALFFAHPPKINERKNSPTQNREMPIPPNYHFVHLGALGGQKFRALGGLRPPTPPSPEQHNRPTQNSEGPRLRHRRPNNRRIHP